MISDHRLTIQQSWSWNCMERNVKTRVVLFYDRPYQLSSDFSLSVGLFTTVSSPCLIPAVLLSTAISQPREQEPQDGKRQAAFSLHPELTRESLMNWLLKAERVRESHEHKKCIKQISLFRRPAGVGRWWRGLWQTSVSSALFRLQGVKACECSFTVWKLSFCILVHLFLLNRTEIKRRIQSNTAM